MKEYILSFKKQVLDFINERLEKAQVNEIDEFLRCMEKKIEYFQHERLIHLIVTMTFAVMEIVAVSAFCISYNLALLILSVLFMVLLVPYVFHYYLLENTVQEFYKMRDQIMSVRNSK